MRFVTYLFVIIILIAPSSATAVEIKSVTIQPVESAHFCKHLGGQGKNPVLKIVHGKNSNDKIKIAMRDFLSDGRVFNHKTKTIKADADGTTIVEENFLPPCNTTNGRVDSDYMFIVTSKDSEKLKKRWFRYNSTQRRIK